MDLDPALTHPYFEEYAFYVGIAAAGLCMKLRGNTADYFSSYSLLWHKQHLGMHGSDGSLSLLKGKTNILNPVLLFFRLSIHALFMSNTVSFSHPRRLCSIYRINNYSHLFRAFPRLLDTLISLPGGLSSHVCHLAPLLSASLSPAFCLSKEGLLVPYQTFMNYEHSLSRRDRDSSLSA